LVFNISSNEITFVGFGFIDDIGLLSVENSEMIMVEKAFHNVQHLLDEREFGLQIHGRALSAAKKLLDSFWFSLGQRLLDL